MPRASTARSDMLDAAFHLLRTDGLTAMRMEDVIDAAGAPRGSTYHHFPSGKAQLVEEAVRQAGSVLCTVLNQSLASGGPHSALETIVEFFRSGLLESQFRAGCPLAPGAMEAAHWPGAHTAAAEAFTTIQDLVAASLWQHGVPRARAESLASTVLATVEGAIVVARAEQSTRCLDRVEVEMGLLLTSVLPEGSGGHVPDSD